MATTNLKAQLAALVELQTVDSEIYALTEEKNAKPAQIESLTREFEDKKKHLAELEKMHLDCQKEKKGEELELGSKEESIKKLQSQLYSLKTNKEYNTMLSQIQDAKADASRVEDKILEAMEKIESAKGNIDTEKARLQEEEKSMNEKQRVIAERVKVIDERLAQLEGARSRITPGIDKAILSQYDRILHNRDGLAIVGVKDNTCMGCNMFVPAQVINLIRMYDRIITCEVCNRILIISDETA